MYLCFCGVWVGYGLLASGLLLLLEHTVEGKARALIFMVGAAAVAFALVLLEWTVDFRLAASAAFALLAWVTAERLDRRDLPDSGSK